VKVAFRPDRATTMLLNLSSNDYLGLSRDPAVKRAAMDAVEKYGIGTTAGRPSARTTELHDLLEAKLAQFKLVPAVVALQSGFAAVMSAVSALAGPDDLVVFDESDHPSTLDGIRLAGCAHATFRHRDPDHLESVLRDARAGGRRYGRVLVATDAVFGLDGEIAPLPAICDVAERHGADVMIDDAHALGILGSAGRGAVDHFGLGERVRVQVGSLSKAIGALGGYVTGRDDVRELLLLRAHQVLYSTLQSPPIVAGCIAAIDLLERDAARRDRLWENTRRFKTELRRLGFDTGQSETPITPIYLGDAERTTGASAMLRDRGILVAALTPPTVPLGRARLRTIMGSQHTAADLDRALAALEQVGHELGAI
jgi:glycine C-acetyltransferase